MYFGYSKEPFHRNCSFEYPQHMFLLSNKKNNFQVHTFMRGGGVLFLRKNYICQHFSFYEQLKFHAQLS